VASLARSPGVDRRIGQRSIPIVANVIGLIN
jgi:hypothetical protein